MLPVDPRTPPQPIANPAAVARESADKIDHFNKIIWRRIAILASALVVVLGIVLGIVFDTVGHIRSTQITNTQIQNHRTDCDATAYADFVQDLIVLVELPKGTTPGQFRAAIKIPSPRC